MNTPPIVSPEEWESARQELLVEEKKLTRARDALAAKRRRMPWLAHERAHPQRQPRVSDLLRNARGDEAMGSTWRFLDITALGRQEEWEDSPDGYPQTPPYEWWIWHDEPNASDVDRAAQVTTRAGR